MYKKILFCACLTEFCEHVFKFSLETAIENNAKLWIYHGLGRLNLSTNEVTKKIEAAETHVTELFGEKMKQRGFDNYAINVSDGDKVSEITKLARNVNVDVIIMGTSTKAPTAAGESATMSPLGSVTAQTVLWAPCPVLIVPPALVPGLTMIRQP
ncbi:MAG: universal stress protein [Deltaproteobacteria bacterium]|nr:universal stress protein [Deltaproteobacteria bacterium]MBW2117648.1 universal stress protein [Deltaproteobacteria bacterium]MBW2342771.1 universal stress protein [Deltaproteobacteria bacterium]